MTKPVQQANRLHQQILGSLLTNRQTTRTEMREMRTKKGWGIVPVDVAVPTIAGNVSWENVERASRRWAAAVA